MEIKPLRKPNYIGKHNWLSELEYLESYGKGSIPENISITSNLQGTYIILCKEHLLTEGRRRCHLQQDLPRHDQMMVHKRIPGKLIMYQKNSAKTLK